MKSIIALIITVFLSNLSIYSQGYLTDSSYLEIIKLDNDTNKVKSLLNYGNALRGSDPENSIQISTTALNISLEIMDRRSILKSYYFIAAGYFSASSLDSCLIYANKAIDISQTINQYKLADIYNILVIVYTDKSDYKNALHYGFECAKLMEKAVDTEGLAYIYNNIGDLYWSKQDMTNASKYFNESKDLFIKLKDSINICDTYINLYLISQKEDKLNYLKKAEKIFLKSNDYYAAATTYNNWAGYHLEETNDYSKSKIYYSKALFYAEEINNTFLLGKIWNGLGILYNVLDKPDSSIICITKSLKISESTYSIRVIGDSYNILYEAHKSLNNSDSALIYFEKSQLIKDSIFHMDILAEIEDANAKYESEKKDSEIAHKELEILTHKNEKSKLIWGAISILFLLGGISLWYLERQKRKKKIAEMILDQKELEANKFKELDLMKNQFFTNISHELRTPLSLILGRLELARESTEQSKLNTNLDQVQKNADRLLKMVNEILDLSKMENSDVIILEEEILIKSFFSRILYSFQSEAEIYGINLVLQCDINISEGIITDSEKVETVVTNIIANAIKFSPTGASIVMDITKGIKNLKISIKDTGPGIPANEIERVFDRFYQASNMDTKTQGGGTGVGLALSKTLIEHLGGSITVKSIVEKGATFLVEFPTEYIVIKDSTTKTKEPKFRNYEPILLNNRKPSVLIIEDNKDMQDYLKEILSADYRVTIANDGYRGLQLLQTTLFDLISSDVMMPKMDGFTLKEKIIELGIQSDVPFIFLTAKKLKEDILEGLRLGVDDYITKPFDKEEYKTRIYNLLNNRKQRLEHQSTISSSESNQSKSVEQQILEKAEKLVIKKMSDPFLKVSDLAEELNYSQRNLSRVIKNLTGYTSVQFILELRLQKAYHLIQYKKRGTISEVQTEVGIESNSHFFKKFKERYGVSPGKLNPLIHN